ncbi:MAG: N-acyl-D-amino-acid deacylase family protein [Burkholderiales bacterium]
MHELLIRGAQVYDGLGNPPVFADVAVDAGRVSSIGTTRATARETVDAGGLALMPGIVDLHTHYDAQITWDRSMSPSPALGVTTAVMGNCGFGIAPCPAQLRETMMKNLSVVEGMDLTALLTGVRWEFETFAEYMAQLRRIGPYLNTAVFAGHSVIRTTVMGEAASERVAPSTAELDAMRRLVREAMDAGAIGFASSFSPNHSGFAGRPMPSTIASDGELRALTGVLGEVGRGVFMSATGPRATPAVMESIAQENGRPAFISTVLTMYNEAAPERAMTYYEACAAAQDRGHEVVILSNCQPLSFDFTLDDPYVMLSHSAFDAIKGLDHAGRKNVYADAGFRARFRADLAQPKPGIIFLGNWERIEVSIAAQPGNKSCEGRSIAALAQARGCDPVDLFCDLALEEDLATHFLGKFYQNDDDMVAPLLKHRAGVITLSDAGAHLIYMCDAGFGLHFLGHWVRDTGHFQLAEGIRRLTSDPARRFRIPERGRLAVGAPADMLLFDPTRVGISRPRVVADLPGGGSRTVRDPLGVHGVWVNGVRVHDGNDYARLAHGPGKVLDRFDI